MVIISGSMEPSELRALLNQGIQAVKTGDHTLARELLLRVLEADDRSEPAWLWLSAALDEPNDQLIALENVLAINPSHPQALARAAALRQQLGQSEAGHQSAAEPIVIQSEILVATSDPIASVVIPLQSNSGQPPATALRGDLILPMEPAAVAYDTLSAEDDPFQCAYCGRQTHRDDERCRYCRRSLLVPGPWRGGGYLYLGLLITGIQLQSALVQALASYLLTTYPQAATILPWFSFWTSSLLLPAILRAIAWGVVVLLLLGDWDSGYAIAATVAAIDMVWAGLGYNLGVLARIQAEVNAGLGVVIFLIGLLAAISQAQSRRRLRVVPDRNLDGAVMFHRRAVVYARQGKWALAALHWRRAITRSPGEPVYYKALGRANAHLGRYAEAVRAYKSGAEADPSDREFTRLIEMVRAHARSS